MISQLHQPSSTQQESQSMSGTRIHELANAGGNVGGKLGAMVGSLVGAFVGAIGGAAVGAIGGAISGAVGGAVKGGNLGHPEPNPGMAEAQTQEKSEEALGGRLATQ